MAVATLDVGRDRATDARELELDAAAEADERERNWTLCQAAEAWQDAGEHDRALALMADVEGEAASFVGIKRADILLGLGRDEEAAAELAAVRADRPGDPETYQLAAELLEEHGKTDEALRWHNIAASMLTEDELAALDDEGGWLCRAASILRGRLRLREELAYPADALDEAVPPLPSPYAGWSRSFPTADELLNSPFVDALAGRCVRMLFWPRGSLAEVAARWPDLVDDTDEESYFAQLEAKLRALADRGAAGAEVVVAEAESMNQHAARRRSNLAESAARLAYMNERSAQGYGRAWPPSRNGTCWCGSERKYKKCCGRPTTGLRERRGRCWSVAVVSRSGRGRRQTESPHGDGASLSSRTVSLTANHSSAARTERIASGSVSAEMGSEGYKAIFASGRSTPGASLNRCRSSRCTPESSNGGLSYR
jgi:hypothetical protein